MLFSFLSSGAEMVGATKELRSPTVLLRLEAGATPVMSVNSAFCFAIAAAASGNMRLIMAWSRPELRFAPGDGGGRPRAIELRFSLVLSLLMASLNFCVIGSGLRQS